MVYSPKRCVYGSCTSRRNETTKIVPGAPGVFFIKFPSPITQSDKCSRWVNACGRTDFSKNDVKRSTYICSRHFEGFSGPTPLNPDPIQNTSPPNLPVATNQERVNNSSILGTRKRKLQKSDNECMNTPRLSLKKDISPKELSFTFSECEQRSSPIQDFCGFSSTPKRIKGGTKAIKFTRSTELATIAMDLKTLSPPPGWSMELFENSAVFSKFKNNFKFMECVFEEDIRKEVTASLKIQNKPIKFEMGENEPLILKSKSDIYEVLKNANQFTCCPGNQDPDFIILYKGQSESHQKRQLRSYYCGKLNGIFSSNCEGFIKTPQKRCFQCSKYRSSLRKLRHRNNLKMTDKQEKGKSYTKVIKKNKKSLVQTESSKNEVKSMMLLLKARLKDEPTGSLMSTFLRQQLQAMHRSKYGMRWDPLFVKWCIYMKNMSKSSYEALRKSKLLVLPTSRTLYNHNHSINSKSGFTTEMFEEMAKECELEKVPEHQKCFVLSLDEMSIKEDLLLNRTTGLVTGLVDVNENHNFLDDLAHKVTNSEKPPLATHILQLMIRGVTSKIKIAFAHFPTKGASAAELNSIIWEAIRRLETSGFRIIAVVGDGASTNRKFFNLSQSYEAKEAQEIPYKTQNLFAMDEERPIFFISDAPHLIKTVSNGFANSGTNSKNTRTLWKNGEAITWKVILRLYYLKLRSQGQFKHLNKLTYSHVYLNSYSKMKVNLAAQILSETVASAIEHLLSKKTNTYKETIEFIRVFNKFFDLCNVNNRVEGIHQRNKNHLPYTNVDDERLKWLECDFIKYLDDWENQVLNRPGKFTKTQRDSMLLSKQTIQGLKITALSTVGVVKFMLSKGAEYVLTQHLNQDPLEQYFGRHRAAGGRNTNPTAWHYGANKDTFKTLKGIVLDAVGGNTQDPMKEIVKDITGMDIDNVEKLQC